MNSIGIRSLAVLIIVCAFAHRSHAESLSASQLADNCRLALDQFNEKRLDAATIAAVKASDGRPVFDGFYEITIGNQVVPIFPFAKGISRATLIALIHRKPNSDPEEPTLDAICPDQTGHKFSWDPSSGTLQFSSAKGEKLTFMFRLDAGTLPNTTWMKPPGDSIWMIETTIPPPMPPLKPSSNDWCDKTQPKDVKVKGTDMKFTMCVHHGTPRGFEYVLRLLVNGNVFTIDPLIINRP